MVALSLAPGLAAAQLSLQAAVDMAQANDPWLTGSRYRQLATEAQSVAAGQWADPMVSVGFANLPVDGFDFNAEPMTQFKVGVSQMLPRGNSAALRRQQLSELSAQQPLLRQDRLARVEATVSQLWLESWRNKESIRLIENDRALFEQLADMVEAAYASALGKARQQDLLRAQLEVVRLEDRLTVLAQQQEVSQAKLGEWLPAGAGPLPALQGPLPALELQAPDWAGTAAPGTPQLQQRLNQQLQQHPLLRSVEQKILAATTAVELTRQKYRPQWGVNASYGYRDDDPSGVERSDFFSVGLSFDLPLFTSQRQDQQVNAAVAELEALKTEQLLTLRSLRAGLEASLLRLARLDQRAALYQDRLLDDIRDQAEAAASAYTTDDGDFAEVVRARIAGLNANIDFLNISIDRLSTIAELNYYFAQAQHDAAQDL
jgi:outer membrane protein TolC